MHDQPATPAAMDRRAELDALLELAAAGIKDIVKAQGAALAT
jgi:ribonuclease PH